MVHAASTAWPFADAAWDRMLEMRAFVETSGNCQWENATRKRGNEADVEAEGMRERGVTDS